MKIMAGIVLYNPNLDRLEECIESVKHQVDFVVCVDNGSRNIDDIRNALIKYSDMILIANAENLGIAAGLNQLLEVANREEAMWLLTLDQDSVVSPNFIDNSRNYMEISDVAIIGPLICDRNDPNQDIKVNRNVEYINECITSVSLMNLQICNIVGIFDEKMFIDYVDFEYCYRVRQCGYKILNNPHAVLVHQLGNGCIKTFLGRKIFVSNHNSLRHYYLVRNCIYFIKKHKLIGRMSLRIVREIFEIIFFEKKKKEKIICVARGVIDGIYL